MQRLLAAFILLLAFAVAELLGSFLSRSLSLGSDSLHMFLDVGSLGLALYVARAAQRRFPAEARILEAKGAFGSGGVLILFSLGIIGYGLHRIFSPVEVESGVMLGIASFGLLINILVLVILRQERKNLSVRAAHLHVLSDTLSSVAVVGAAIAIPLTGLQMLDPLASICIAAFIALSAFRIMQEAREAWREHRTALS